MAERTGIEWCDHTFNPWLGCTKVSAACDNCYAEALMDHRHHRVQWGGPRARTSEQNWRQPLRWNRAARCDGVRRKVFCASLAGVFDNQVPDRWRGDLWNLIAECTELDWLLLTKRPQNIEKMLVGPLLPFMPHVWLGTTAENQEEYNRRWGALSRIPAAQRFISYEPALGPLDISANLKPNWIIAGGESGPNARPAHPDWFRSLRDQCNAAGVPFFFKQWGEHLPLPGYTAAGEIPDPQDTDVPPTIRRGHNTTGDQVWRRVGKSRAGRLLDGKEHSEMPG